jgi:hypothetical protein
MIRKDGYPGPDDGDQEQHVEEVLPPDPGREPRPAFGPGRNNPAWIFPDELRDRRDTTQPFGHGHGSDQQHEADWQQPKQVEPFAFP